MRKTSDDIFVIIKETVHDVNLLEIPLTVKQITLISCKIHNIPVDFFVKFKNLKCIELKDNYLTDINFNFSNSVIWLDVSMNKLLNSSFESFKPLNLVHLDISFNHLTELLPIFSGIKEIIYDHNDILEKKYKIDFTS